MATKCAQRGDEGGADTDCIFIQQLPPELRNEIYDQVIAVHNIDGKAHLADLKPALRQSTGLAATCTQINQELMGRIRNMLSKIALHYPIFLHLRAHTYDIRHDLQIVHRLVRDCETTLERMISPITSSSTKSGFHKLHIHVDITEDDFYASVLMELGRLAVAFMWEPQPLLHPDHTTISIDLSVMRMAPSVPTQRGPEAANTLEEIWVETYREAIRRRKEQEQNPLSTVVPSRWNTTLWHFLFSKELEIFMR